ncbi:MAG TPA: YcnI family protein [Pseudonocardiaceae bacterium]|jgi:uncharacterized protein YcnI|nr:YcnI family protein [Pseudonocardiaceae bacterium]
MSAQRKFARRLITTMTATGFLVAAAAGVASAHVTAHSPDPVVKGGRAEVVFRVPDEEATAHTVKVQVNFSATSPIGSASIRPVPGWTATIQMMTLPKPVNIANETLTAAVKSVTWTASAGEGIAPGQFEEFPVSLASLPDNTGTFVAPAVQTYDNGDVVQWNQPTVAGQPEPEHPAPHLALAAKADAAIAAAPAANAASVTAAAPSSDGTARWLGGVGIVVAALALGAALGALFRRGRTGASA